MNVGSDESVTINELAAAVEAQLGRPCAIARTPYQEVFGDQFCAVERRVPDTRLLKEATGWRPRLGLLDIVRDCLAECEALRPRSR